MFEKIFGELLWRSHIPGGQMLKVFDFCLIGLPPWNGQNCSRLIASQPSPLRSDPFGALGLTEVAFNFLQSNIGQKPLFVLGVGWFLCLFWLVLQKLPKGYQAGSLDLDSQVGEGEMGTNLEESLSKDFISERLENQLHEIKQQLEEHSRYESMHSLIAEDMCEVKVWLKKKGSDKDEFLKTSKIFNRMSSTVQSFISRHHRKLSNEDHEALKTVVSTFKLFEKVCLVQMEPLLELSEKTSLQKLRKWRQTLDVFAEIAESKLVLPKEMTLCLRTISKWVIKVTAKEYDNPEKERCRKTLRRSAGFVAYQLEKSQPTETLEFTLGKMPQQQLLEETRKRLHLLDLLSPSNNEEAQEQRETRKYLLEVLGN